MADENNQEAAAANTDAATSKKPRTLSEGDISLTRSRLAGSVSHVGATSGGKGSLVSLTGKKLAGKPAEIGDPDAH